MHKRQTITTPKAPAPIGPYSQAVLSGDTLYVSGQIALDPQSGQLKIDDLKDETHCVMRNLKAILNQAQMNFDQVVKCTIFISDMNDFGIINTIYGQYFDEKNAPARETVQVAALPKNVHIEISAIAVK